MPASAFRLLTVPLLFVAALLLACAPAEPSSTPGASPVTAAASTSTAIGVAQPTPTAAPVAGDTPSAPAEPATITYGYRVINVYPHDPEAFTQGLVYEDGLFYEGTGLYGRSSLRHVAIETGEVLQIHNLAAAYFGEGIAVVGDRIWQLTWREHTAFLYDKATFEQLDTVQYPTEGWGLTYDGTRLIMSDGTANLYFRHPETFELLGQVGVHDDDGPVVRLNELEYIGGQVYANIWQTDLIAIIDPASGRVVGWIDLTGLLQADRYPQAVDVLNGIAYDAAGGRLFVTGKLWPKLFEIELVSPSLSYLPLIARDSGHAFGPAAMEQYLLCNTVSSQ